MRRAIIEGIGGWLPPRVVTNDELAARLDTSDEWIRTRTGIRARHVVSDGMLTSQLAVQAGAKALKSAGTDDVDMVVLATTTPDRPCPATAPEVARQLGLTGRPAFDVMAVCTGFLYALATASGLVAAGTADRVLVVGAEAFSTIVDPGDRSAAAVFGDGAGALLLRAGDDGEPGAVGPVTLGSDGALTDLITVRAGGVEERTRPRPMDDADRYFAMRGREVFGHAVTRMTQAALTAVDQAGWRPEDVDRLVGHQANLRILHAVADQLDLPHDRLVIHLDQVGNTAAASIPLALWHANATGRLRPGDRVALTAFGGGATWGATTLTWPALTTV
ncbi:beta-ketoacyl-ACP synthase III [Streptomyces hainanensis]|uniref:Beta-ketoacyl-[acyl-carrier-protein] synthase III n=1 Tax=Streptomyces hainanensis TaxID=402648 RepID=A0A4R4TPL4_9ACTN|nr:beta-ketoacyl-ACP synthase III [Streptomyces hainanensis]TDC77874.1 ketoacyl-ACP synthase III [Streptomyces hainanensis]